MQYVVESLSHILQGTINSNLIIFLLSILPILELRGGLIAAAILGVNFKLAFLICYFGSLLPIPFILFFIDKIFLFFKKTKLKNIIEKIEKRAKNKSRDILKYEQLGLVIFVGIPLPGTGAWTGALVAKLAGIEFKKALFLIAIGNLIAGILMLIFSYGILEFLKV